MRPLWRIAFTVAFTVLSVTSGAKDGAFRSTKHGDPVKGPQRRMDKPAGSCVQCHDGHMSHWRDGGRSPRSEGAGASGSCFDCHAVAPMDGGAFPGEAEWTNSSHGRERMTRPGAMRSSANSCVACHDPHGVRDGKGVIPALLAERVTKLCSGCHDGSRGADIRGELLKPYWHGQDARGQHDPSEARVVDGGAPQTTPVDRHVSCADCHNAHLLRPDAVVSGDDAAASPLLAGVARVQVLHGPAGSQPSYRFLAANDPSPALEYEICFRCHSSATKLPPQNEDIARTTNPANASFHPIQAEGRNRGIDANAFVLGMSAESRVRCTDCHGSDSSRVRGLHGSSHEHLLRQRYASDGATMARTDLCFTCHSWQVYGEARSEPAVQAASRFNAPAGAGHAFHVGSQRIHCAACHEVHGSVKQPALIAVRKRPGITSYTQTPAGGTCTPTCHTTRTYRVNYPR